VTARRKSEPRRVEAVLGRVLDDLGLGSARIAMRIQERWPALVGEAAAAHSTPEGLRGSTLEVRVDASVWGQQLQVRSAEIVAALRELLGEAAPSELRFRIG
jgi:predicted nucleic acid-binding Zn ribbon protein